MNRGGALQSKRRGWQNSGGKTQTRSGRLAIRPISASEFWELTHENPPVKLGNGGSKISGRMIAFPAQTRHPKYLSE